MDRNPLHRHADMLAEERAVARQTFGCAVDIDVAVGHFAAAFACDHHHRADAAFDIDTAVAAGRAGQRVQRVELFLALGDILADRLDHLGTFMERQRAQGWATGQSRPVEHALHVEARAACLRDQLSIDGTVNGARLVIRRDPFARRKTFGFQHGLSPLVVGGTMTEARGEINTIDRMVGFVQGAARGARGRQR